MQGNQGTFTSFQPNAGMIQAVQPLYPGFNEAPQQSKYDRKTAMGLGVTQIIIGVVCFLLNIVLILISSGLAIVSYGIWGGAMIFVAGLLQVLTAKRVENKCLIIGTMVMTILAACACAVIVGFSIPVAATGDITRQDRYYYDPYYSSGNNNYYTERKRQEAVFAISVVLAILGFVEAIIAIVTSALCCGAVCCKSNKVPIPVYIIGNQPYAFQANYPGTTLPPVQTPLPYQPPAPQVNPNLQASGLASDPPPNYDNRFDPGAKPNY